MRVIGELALSTCKVSFFRWNQKFLVKYELGKLEQIYKVSEIDVRGEDDLKRIFSDDKFIAGVLERFEAMGAALSAAVD